MNPPRTARRAATARERARAELTREIKEEARRQLVATGAEGLSLRAVARELGMVSSALYRYYPSRDELLTALIIDAYNALGAAAEHAIAGPAPARERWTAACHAIRDWARSNPHEYALIYGSPVPGYRAPDATIGPASRVPLAFAGVVRDALAAGELAAPPEAVPVTGALAEQAAALSAALAGTKTSAESSGAPASVPPDALVRAVIAWTQLYGMISFELFGQFVGSFEPADALFAYTVAQLTAFVGLRRAPLGERFTRSSARRYSRSVNKQERTYTVLRDRIHSGAFAPRARLNIDGLARELGVSAIPVREALRRLEAEGWVKFQPNVGAIVAPVDATAWEQQMVAVAILEGAATADAAANLRTSDMTKVRSLAAEMEQVAAEGDLSKFSRLNRRLHATIFARCANTYLLELLEQTNQRLDRIRDTMFTYLPERSKAAIGEHAHLIELLEGGDPVEIERYARWHKLQTVAAYRATREPPR